MFSNLISVNGHGHIYKRSVDEYLPITNILKIPTNAYSDEFNELIVGKFWLMINKGICASLQIMTNTKHTVILKPKWVIK